MTSAILLVGLLVGVPAASHDSPPASSARVLRPAGLSLGDARLLARHRSDPSGFSPHFGRSDPAAHVARFGGAGGGGGVPPKARDDGIQAMLTRPKMNTTLQMSVQWRGN